jgi:flagellar biogenesis protein FliO
MESENKKKESSSKFQKFFDWLGIRRALLLFFTIIYLIKNYMKSEYLSNMDPDSPSLWDDKEPELPSQNPLFYQTLEQSQSMSNRTQVLLKATLFVFLILLILRRVNDLQTRPENRRTQ